MVISGDPHDVCRLFYGIWRLGIDDSVAGAEGLIAWHAAAGKAAAGNVAGVQATANMVATERTIAKNAAAAPEIVVVGRPASTEMAAVGQTVAFKPVVGSKRRVPSILTLLTARVRSEVDPVGREAAEKVALQGDRGIQAEINPEGLDVTVGTDQSQGQGQNCEEHARQEDRASRGENDPNRIAAKQETGKG